MKVQEVLLRAMAKKMTWWQAAEIIGVSERTLLHDPHKTFSADLDEEVESSAIAVFR